MNYKNFIALLLVANLLLSGCSAGLGSIASATPTTTSAPTTTPTASASPTPTTPPDISYIELARQAGSIRFQVDEALQGPPFSVWLPATYLDTYRPWESGYYWKSGYYLDEAAKRLGDYAYDIYAGNKLFTGSDETFYYDSPHANECSALERTVDVGTVDFAIRTGQDPQLADMTLANYAGLLAIALQQMRGDYHLYPQVSEAFFAPGFEAWKLVTAFDLSDYAPYTYRVTFIDYILKAGERIWVLTFSVDTQLFWEAGACAYLADDFDLIARTFELVPNE